MKLKIVHPFWQVLGMGALAGMRSSSAPVIASHILSHHPTKMLQRSPLNFMQSKNVAMALKVMSLGEIVADKLPWTPNRIKPTSVAVRCLSGALAGAGVFKATGNNAIIGGLIGAAAAFASTFGSFYLRKGAVSKTKFIDPLVGAVEDALVIGAGWGLTRIP